ncbi:ribonuclease P protein component [Rhodoligotrophos defluvii]|uniref:ribonuclease P protein component n=1 Tax=Rhodoligotrophos defluvii TaxID=2561934 RepID=UPI00195FC024|nr:ribonuclease P protein component [Rhodoligotrophos defluvii]
MERIKRRRDFLAAARAFSFVTPGLVLQARDRGDDAAARIGLTATRKLGKAVTRNRVKRRLRAAAESVLPEAGLPGFDYVIIGRSHTAERDFADLQADIRRAADKVHAAWQARKVSGIRAEAAKDPDRKAEVSPGDSPEARTS